MDYYSLHSNLFIQNGCIKNNLGDKSHQQILGSSLLLKHCHGNIGHFINDHYYSFYVLATRKDIFNLKSFDNILIPGGSCKNYVFIALNCLPKNIQKKIIILDKDVKYCVQNAYIGCTDRTLSFKENGKTLIKEMRFNFLRNTGFGNNINSNGIFIYQNTYPQNKTTYGRRILNLSEIKNFFNKNGKDVYCANGPDWFLKNSPEFIFDKMLSFKNFFGPWGAWVCNLVFSRPLSNIRLLIHPKNYQSWYKSKNPLDGWSQSYLHNYELDNNFDYIYPNNKVPIEQIPYNLSENMQSQEIICDFNVELNSDLSNIF